MQAIRFSTLETVRKRMHGALKLRWYALRADGDALRTITTISTGFLISLNTDTQEGAAQYLLTVDIARTGGLTPAQIEQTFMVALVDEATTTEERYEMDTKTPPILNGGRFIFGLHRRLGDGRAVI